MTVLYQIIGSVYEAIAIQAQHSRLGSYSGKGNLNF